MNTKLHATATARCAQRECCRADFARKWREQGVAPDEIEEILCTLEREGFIDEARYARAFTADKLRYDRWGRLKIRAALMAKGISSSDINAALDTIDAEEYETTLRAVLQAKRRSVKAESDFELRRKLANFAAGRGFESNLIFRFLDIGEDDF